MVTVPSAAMETKAESCAAALLLPAAASQALAGRGISASSARPPPASSDALSTVRRSRRTRDCSSDTDGAANPVVAAAAAEVAGHRGVDLIDAGLGGVPEQRAGGHDLPCLTVAALHHIDFQPRLLQSRADCGGADVFDGMDPGIYDTADRQLERALRSAVDVDRAGAAQSLAASILGAHQAQLVAQHPEEGHLRRNIDLSSHAINIESIRHRSSSSARSTFSSERSRESRWASITSRRRRPATATVLTTSRKRRAHCWSRSRSSPGTSSHASGKRNLLGDAVNVAPAQQNLTRRHSHHASSRKHPLEARRRAAVGACVQQRHDDAAVRDVEVGVAAGETLARRAGPGALAGEDAARLARAHVQRPRHLQPRHLKAPAACIPRILEPLPGIERDRVLRVATLVGPGETYVSGTHEAGELVDVTVGFVVEHALAEPDDLLHAEVVAQYAVDLGPIQARVAVRVEQAFFSDQRRALAVHVNGAALVDDGGAIARTALDLQYLGRHQLVLVPGKVQPAVQASPGVEVPVDPAHGAAAVDDAARADVAHPAVIVHELHDTHAFRLPLPGDLKLGP